MEEEFKALFFPFKSLENPPLHLYQPLNRLMVQASDVRLLLQPDVAAKETQLAPTF